MAGKSLERGAGVVLPDGPLRRNPIPPGRLQRELLNSFPTYESYLFPYRP
jgi:hypothetical protein